MTIPHKSVVGASVSNMKIAVYGFGSMPAAWRHLYEIAKLENVNIKWRMILPTPDWRDVVDGLLAHEDVLDVYRQLPRVSAGDLSCVAGYHGNFVEDVDADKRPNSWLRGRHRLVRGAEYYKLFKKFYHDREVTHLLMPTIELSAAKIAVAAAAELNVRVLALADMRCLTGTFFAIDARETPPPYGVVTDEMRLQAAKFIEEFRYKVRPPRALPLEFSFENDRRLFGLTPSLPKRMLRFIHRLFERPDLFSLDTIRVSFMRNIPVLRKIVRGLRQYRNASQFDFGELNALPEKFIYYPIQYTPEASINTPAPYFIDQERAIDALRYAMPNDFVLVVKEHWACIPVRPVPFMRRIRRLPGISVARYDLPSLELVRRASLTATVTGTAAMEAALLGRPALVLAPYLPAHVVGRVADIGALGAEIKRAIEHPVSDAALVDRVAILMNVRYPFFYGSTGEAGEPLLGANNMRRFLLSVVDHINRCERSGAPRVDAAADLPLP